MCLPTQCGQFSEQRSSSFAIANEFCVLGKRYIKESVHELEAYVDASRVASIKRTSFKLLACCSSTTVWMQCCFSSRAVRELLRNCSRNAREIQFCAIWTRSNKNCIASTLLLASSSQAVLRRLCLQSDAFNASIYYMYVSSSQNRFFEEPLTERTLFVVANDRRSLKCSHCCWRTMTSGNKLFRPYYSKSVICIVVHSIWIMKDNE